MKKYQKPILNLIACSLCDVITASVDPGRDDIKWDK